MALSSVETMSVEVNAKSVFTTTIIHGGLLLPIRKVPERR